MRLGTCVAVELVVGAALATGLTASAAWGYGEMRRQFGAAEEVGLADDTAAMQGSALAHLTRPDVAPIDGGPLAAVIAAAAPGSAPSSLDAAPSSLDAAPTPADAAAATAAAATAAAAELAAGAEDAPFDPGADDALLAPLRTAALERVKVNRGGSTISFRLDFVGGGRASFKPEQIQPQLPRWEVAAYRIDRLLGVNAVSPAFPRAFSLEELYGALDRDGRSSLSRLREELISRKDPDDPKRRIVAGEVQWWIPVIEMARITKHEIDETDGIVTWKRYLRAGATIPPESYDMVRQISTMVLFDFVIDNIDRWSGSNARVSPDGTKLYFMDNTLAFGDDPNGHRKSRTYLERSQAFSRRLVARLRALTEDEVRAALEPDRGPYEELLGDAEIEALMGRRDTALAYIDDLIEEHGEEAVLVFP
jgi:hypothetical protein